MICLHFGAWKSNQLLQRLHRQLRQAVLVWTQMKLQQKQELISDFPKHSRKYFYTRGKLNLTLHSKSFQRVEREDRKTSSKKDNWVILMSLICLSYLNIFDYTSYCTPYLDPSCITTKNSINSGSNYSQTLLAGTLFFFATKVGFLANISILVKLQP